MHGQAQMQMQPTLSRINVNQLLIKASTKKEIYNFLTLDCEAYLPKKDTINVHFLKQITRAHKEVRLPLTSNIVHQAIGGEGGCCASDRRLDGG